MRFCSSKLLRPLLFLILLGIACLIFSKLFLLTETFENNVIFQANEARNKSFLAIENTAKLPIPLNSTASSLARSLSLLLNGTDSSFASIKARAAQPLFLTLSTIPYLSQVAYMGSDGQLFSYYTDQEQTYALFSNTTSPSVLCTQPVNRDTGKLYGQEIFSNSTLTVDRSRFPENGKMEYYSLEMGSNNKDLLFVNEVAMDGRTMISVGSPAQPVIDQFAGLDFHGGDFHLATNDDRVLIATKLPDTQIVVDNETVSLRLMKHNGDLEDKVTNHSCKLDNDERGHFSATIKGKQYVLYCSSVIVHGVKLAYVLSFPTNGKESLAHKNSKLALMLLVLMLVIIVVSLLVFIILIVKGARREMFLCAALIKQTESTQQAERKSMNKSLAFARASHDMRGSLAALTLLSENCREGANPDSDLATNLTQIDTCARDMLGIVNSVLDTSKIEAGKMQLEEEEFDLAKVLDDVVDMYYSLGIRKGLDVILDPCDGSILKVYLVRGDRGKLKQILCNLLSNAIKFTSEGHVVVRIIVRKTSEENAIIASNRSSTLNCLSRLCFKGNGSFSSLDDLHTVQQDPNCMEFVFEVDDTGSGIPKDRQKSVFENFVQVKETAFGQEGCGLGLGIVQSLVRLMGGEIRIIDKEPGERGTCFRFNVFLTCNAASTDIGEQGNHMHNGGSPADVLHYIGLHMRSPMPRLEGSHAILLLAGEERRKISRKVMENFGVKVSVAKRSKDLNRILETTKQRLDSLQFSFSEKESSPVDYLSASSNSNLGLSEGPASAKDRPDQTLSRSKKSNSKGSMSFILVVIDANAGPFLELCSIVSSFKKEIQSCWCKVVWLENPIIHNGDSREPEGDRISPPWDYVLSKPLHGSRLYEVLGLLPEFGGAFLPNSLKVKAAPAQENKHYIQSTPSKSSFQISHESELHKSINSPDKRHQLEEIVIHRSAEKTHEKPLNGKSVLVVDDTAMMRKLTSVSLSKLGAKVDVCENGKEAFDVVCKALNDQKDIHPKALPYDYIFMDCEMPEMDGYEATGLIRMEEKKHGIHTPIFALTAHAMAEEASKTANAGMDFHLTKPLQHDKLLDAIRSI